MVLYELLNEAFNANESDLTDETVIMDLEEWDSMAHMLFITQLEERYEIDLDGNQIASMVTVGDIKKVLTEMGKI